MTINPKKPLAAIELVPAAPEEEPIVGNLLQLYAHDFSEFHNVELGMDGRFSYKQLPLYWSDSSRHPFLVWLDGKLAGLVFVKTGSEISGDASVWDMAEFFIVRAYRRRGIGTEVAQLAWKRFPGPWEVRVIEANGPACRFWERAIAEFTGEVTRSIRFEKGGKSWYLFSFESRGHP